MKFLFSLFGFILFSLKVLAAETLMDHLPMRYANIFDVLQRQKARNEYSRPQKILNFVPGGLFLHGHLQFYEKYEAEISTIELDLELASLINEAISEEFKVKTLKQITPDRPLMKKEFDESAVCLGLRMGAHEPTINFQERKSEFERLIIEIQTGWHEDSQNQNDVTLMKSIPQIFLTREKGLYTDLIEKLLNKIGFKVTVSEDLDLPLKSVMLTVPKQYFKGNDDPSDFYNKSGFIRVIPEIEKVRVVYANIKKRRSTGSEDDMDETKEFPLGSEYRQDQENHPPRNKSAKAKKQRDLQ